MAKKKKKKKAAAGPLRGFMGPAYGPMPQPDPPPTTVPRSYFDMRDRTLVAKAIAEMGFWIEVPEAGLPGKFGSTSFLVVASGDASPRFVDSSKAIVVHIGNHMCRCWNPLTGTPGGKMTREVSTSALAQALRRPPEPNSATQCFDQLFSQLTGVE